jgi:molybdopterin biosynthesis enzyme
MVRLKGFKERMDTRSALNLIRSCKIKRVGSEIVSIFKACGRVLAEDVKAKYDVPHFDRSAVDGYAVFRTRSPTYLYVSRQCDP